MFKYAIVEDGVVTNLVRAHAGYAQANNLIFASDATVGVGFTYTEENGFRPPKPYPSWTWGYCELCGGKYTWIPPVEYPSDYASGPLDQPEGTRLYSWNEETQSWDQIADIE